jgi:hypothetical protein
MKLSEPLRALILVASALLLSAASGDLPRPSVQSQGRSTHQGNDHDQSQQAQTDAQPTPSAEISETPKSAEPIGSHPPVQQIRRDDRNSAESPICRTLKIWIAGITAQGFFNFVIAFATFLLAIFTWKLVRVTRDMHTVSVEATKVSKDSAAAAQSSADAAKAQLEFRLRMNKI